MSAKRYIKIFVIFIFAIAASLALTNYYLDPFRIYHTPVIAPGKYLSQDRYQNAGLIADNLGRLKCCDSVLIGTSLSQNWDAKDMDATMGGKTLNLSMAGSSAREQKIIIESAIATGQVKTIYWELYDRYFERTMPPVNSPELIKESPGQFFPDFLYDRTLLNDGRYIFSVDPIVSFFSRLRNGRSLYESKAWYLQHVNDFYKGDNLAARHPDVLSKSDNYTAFENLSPIDEIIVPIVTQNPEIEFHLFIPPYSLHYYAILSHATYADMMGMRVYLARKLARHPNVKIHYFDKNNRNIENLDLYKDLTHYHPDFYAEMLDQMRDSSAMVESKKIDDYIHLMTRRVNSYIKALKDK